MYMVYIPVYSVYAIYTGEYMSVSWTVYMVYIPVYSVYAIYRGEYKFSVVDSVYNGVYTCIWCIYHIQERQVSVMGSVYMVVYTCI